jgi:hypothetical protein
MNNPMETCFRIALAMSLVQAIPAFAQQSEGWRRVGDPRPTQPQQQQQPQYQQQPQAQQQQLPPEAPPPDAQLRVPAGTWITVRVNQPLSSDRNQPGDAFTATLAQPIVAEGRVIARRGQTVGGRVVEVQKAGHVKGTSRLGIELTELSLVDGQQLPIRTQLALRQGPTSVGRDAAAIGTATGVGALIGAAADGGFGAGMGAIAGAGASVIGVLVTRGAPAVVYPEMLLTFRLEEPLVVSTERSYQAFQPATQDAYEQPNTYRVAPPPVAPRPYPYYYAGGYAPYGYYPPYPAYFGPYIGTSVFFYSGPRYRYYGRGYGYRRW